MMKWVLYGILILGVAFSWFMFNGAEENIRQEEAKLTALKNNDSGEDMTKEIGDQEAKVESAKGSKTGSGILLTFLTAGLVGIVVVSHVLPMLAHRVTHAVYDSGEEVEKDPMHDGRAKVAQGDWEGAIEAFRMAAEAQPLNRLPWVEIAKIQLDQLEDTPAAVQTLRTAIEGQEWEENDAAFLMFRLAEIYETKVGDHNSAAIIMNQVIEQFPETRHSANARHKLREWGLS